MTVACPFYSQVEDADVLSVDELFNLRFVSNKFDYKARLQERSKYTMFLKERLKNQVAAVMEKESEFIMKEDKLNTLIMALDAKTLEHEVSNHNFSRLTLTLTFNSRPRHEGNNDETQSR